MTLDGDKMLHTPDRDYVRTFCTAVWSLTELHPTVAVSSHRGDGRLTQEGQMSPRLTAAIVTRPQRVNVVPPGRWRRGCTNYEDRLNH